MAEGDPVTDLDLMIPLKVALMRHGGMLARRKPGGNETEIVAKELVKALRLCGFRISYGRPALWHTAGVTKGEPEERG